MTAEAHGGDGLARRWRSLSPGMRWLLSAVAAVAGLNLALAGLEKVTGGSAPGGPTSSSYATGVEGLAAYADLLGEHGHPVGRLRTRLHRAELDRRTTVVVADPHSLSTDESEALGRFVRDGGRLVAAGEGTAPALRRILGPGLEWAPQRSSVARPLAPAPEVDDLRLVRPGGAGVWRHAGPTLPVLGDGDDATLATVASLGRGRVVAVADASVWHNGMLDRADNAAFGLAAAGEAGRAVRFAEAHHGYGAGQGFDAVPSRWKWALGTLALATVAWMWSQGRRFGPPERLERDLPPPRRAYVDAMAASLAKTRQPAAAIEPLQSAARRLLARRGGLADDADGEALRRAGRHLGLPELELAAVLAPAAGDEDVMAAARALARLEGGQR